MEYTKRLNANVYRFESLHDMAINVKQGIHEARYTDLLRLMNRHQYGNHSSMGRDVYNVNHAFELAEKDWPEGLRTAEELLNKVRDHHIERPVSIRRSPKWSEDHGDEVDIDRLRSGIAYWRTTERVYRPAITHITIVCDNSAPSMMGPSAMTWRGMAAIGLAELLEAAGYRTEIFSMFYGDRAYNDREAYVQILELKRCEDMIDRSLLVNVLSGWFFRGASLAGTFLRGPQYMQKDSIGLATNIGSYAKTVLNSPKAVVADGSSVYDEQSAIRWITKSLEDLTKPPPPPARPIDTPAEQVVYVPPMKPMPQAERNRLEKLRKELEKQRRL